MAVARTTRLYASATPPAPPLLDHDLPGPARAVSISTPWFRGRCGHRLLIAAMASIACPPDAFLSVHLAECIWQEKRRRAGDMDLRSSATTVEGRVKFRHEIALRTHRRDRQAADIVTVVQCTQIFHGKRRSRFVGLRRHALGSTAPWLVFSALRPP